MLYLWQKGDTIYSLIQKINSGYVKNTYLSYPSCTILKLLQRPSKLCSQLYLLSWLISCYETTCKGSNLMMVKVIKST